MNTKYILIALITFALFSACSDDFLDKKPLVQSSAETYYSNESEANDAVIGCYSVMQNESFQLAPFMLIGDDCSDDCDLGNSKSEAFSWLGANAQALQKFDVLPTNSQNNALWTRGFRGITYTTQAIQRISENLSIPEAKRNQFIGEAHYLRALYYFFLTRQHGGLPIIDHILSYDEYYMSRSTQAETWAFIETELKAAVELLPEKSKYSSSDLGRATKGAANALLGKVYMYQSKFAEAYTVLKMVVESGEYKLEANYVDVSTIEHENGIESIFEIQHNTTGTGWADANEGSILSFYEHDADPSDAVKWHNGWSMHCPTQDLVDSYETGDPRLHATVIFKDEMFDGHVNKNIASSTGYQSKKWYVPYAKRSQTDQSDNPKNVIFYRYADLLLYIAEAANEIGKPDEALLYLEQVRGRARSNSMDVTVLPRITESGKDALRLLIWHERRVELACEGQRFWDLVRQKRAGTIMRAYSANYKSIKGQFFVDGKSEIFPIPGTQVTLSNGTMAQNPGY